MTSVNYNYSSAEVGGSNLGYYIFFLADAMCVLFASLVVGIILTINKAKGKCQSIWDTPAKRLLINLMIPLVTGGLFCLVLLYHGFVVLIPPATLIFYGLFLINASKYTLDDIRYLGISEITIGIIASVYVGFGLLFWAVGLGLFHIIYAIVKYYKYER